MYVEAESHEAAAYPAKVALRELHPLTSAAQRQMLSVVRFDIVSLFGVHFLT
jgi:hypothetical protein